MKILPDNWSLQPVGDICSEIVDCINKTAPTVEGPTRYKMIRTTNVRHGRVSTEEVRYVDEKTYQRWTRRRVPKRNDIVLTREAPLGEVGLIRTDENLFLGQRTMMYRADACTTDQNFLYYAFQGGIVQGQIRSWGSGATVEHLRVPDASKFQVPVPPIKEQKNIAAILTAYDDLIENNRERITLLERIAEEIYREWFVRLRFPGHEHAPVHKGVPEGWKVHRMRDLISYYIGGGWGEEQRSTEFSDPAFVIRGTDLPGIAVGDVSSVPHRHHKPSNLRSRKLVEGDVVFEVSGGSKDQLLGRTAVISKELIERFDNRVMCASFCKLIRPNSSLILPVVLGQFFKLYYSTGLVGTFQVQSTGISNYQFEAFLSAQTLLVPPADLQSRYSDIAETCSKQIDVLAAQSQKLAETRDLLLNRLISGKLRVDDLDIQFPPSMHAEAA